MIHLTLSEAAGIIVLAVIAALYAVARVAYRDGHAAGRLEERAEFNRAKIEEARRQRAVTDQWKLWEAEQAEWKQKNAGRHDRTLITRNRTAPAPLTGGGTGELRALERRADEFIARLEAGEDIWRTENGL